MLGPTRDLRTRQLDGHPFLLSLPERWVTSLMVEGSPAAWGSPDHGPRHWDRVAQNGVRLGLVTRADLPVVLAFALIHDAFRLHEYDDPKHGDRAAEWALSAKDLLGFDKQRMKTLEIAIREHDKGHVYSSSTVGTCWDADRLDLPRVGIQPEEQFLSTDAAKEEVRRGY